MSFQSVIISVIGQPPILNCCIYRGGEEKHFLKHKSYIIHIAQVISLAILMRRGHGNFSNHIRKSHCSIAQTCILSKPSPIWIRIQWDHLLFVPSLPSKLKPKIFQIFWLIRQILEHGISKEIVWWEQGFSCYKEKQWPCSALQHNWCGH